MTTNIKTVLWDIERLSDVIQDFSFFPIAVNGIDTKEGNAEIIMPPSDKNRNAVIEFLGRYGYKPSRVFGKDIKGVHKSVITFKCETDAEIVPVLKKIAYDAKMKIRSYQLDILNSEIKNLRKQSTTVHSGVFSRGVGVIKNSVNTLNNIVESQQRTLREYGD